MSLCNSHNTIQYWARDIKKKIKKTVKDNDLSNLSEVLNLVEKIIEESRDAKKKGQRMENRLRKYRNSIESLGFSRV